MMYSYQQLMRSGLAAPRKEIVTHGIAALVSRSRGNQPANSGGAAPASDATTAAPAEPVEGVAPAEGATAAAPAAPDTPEDEGDAAVRQGRRHR